MAFWRSKKTDDLNTLLDEEAAAEQDAFSKDATPPTRETIQTRETTAQAPTAVEALAPGVLSRPVQAQGAVLPPSKSPPPPPPPPPPSARPAAPSSAPPADAKVQPPKPPPFDDELIPIEALPESESAGFGVEQAVELLRELPNRNIDLVMSVVAKTLESVNVDVVSLIRSAEDRTKDIDANIVQLKQDIGRLDDEIRQKKKQILELEDRQREVSMVKDRLSLARADRAGADRGALDGSRRATGNLGAASATLSQTGLAPSAAPSAASSTAVISERPTISMKPTPPGPSSVPSVSGSSGLPAPNAAKESSSRIPGPRLPPIDADPKQDDDS